MFWFRSAFWRSGWRLSMDMPPHVLCFISLLMNMSCTNINRQLQPSTGKKSNSMLTWHEDFEIFTPPINGPQLHRWWPQLISDSGSLIKHSQISMGDNCSQFKRCVRWTINLLANYCNFMLKLCSNRFTIRAIQLPSIRETECHKLQQLLKPNEGLILNTAYLTPRKSPLYIIYNVYMVEYI